MTEIVTVIAHAKAKPGQQEQARAMLQALVAPSRAEEGCINYDLHQAINDPDLFVFHENWATLAALEAHARSEHSVRFRQKCAEVLAEGPVVSRWKRVI